MRPPALPVPVARPSRYTAQAMLSALQHHVLSFLLPGLLALLALPVHVVYDAVPRTPSRVAATLVAAYVLGHLLQSLAALVERLLPPIDRAAQSGMPAYVLDAARRKMARALGASP